MKNRQHIDGFGNLSAKDKAQVTGWFDGEFALWFYLCLYNDTELANRFEMSNLLVKRRAAQMKLLNKICDKTGYTPTYFLARIRVTLPKLYPTLKNLDAFKNNVESGKFTGISRDNLKKGASFFTSTFCWMLAPTIQDLAFDMETGTINFQTDFTRIIKDSEDDFDGDTDALTDPYSIHNPANAGKTQAQLDAKKTADLKALEDARLAQIEADRLAAESAKKKNTMLLGGGIGLMALALFTIKK